MQHILKAVYIFTVSGLKTPCQFNGTDLSLWQPSALTSFKANLNFNIFDIKNRNINHTLQSVIAYISTFYLAMTIKHTLIYHFTKYSKVVGIGNHFLIVFNFMHTYFWDFLFW